MMDEPIKKRVDESWKEQAEREKHVPGTQAPQGEAPSSTKTDVPREGAPESLEARFDVFLSGLTMETLIALGDMPHPATKRQAVNLPQAKYLIDLLGVLEQKTKGNLTADEERLLKDALYQLRMRYLGKSGGVAPA